ncbi:Werner Syndrome-like exonuclease [Chenopodium quinoa]|uniref:3'-5' exonuclease domain-containing protein n=1 Tax=Chenopodium quinoa TaxID=63459 RepID=A0A803LZY1_CHEQI|nr:Werner Syndrome-like exonuclease [Chenopodium quinoa]
MAASPTIVSHHQTNTYTVYDVTCFNHRVRTIVTRCPDVVTSWITHIRSNHHPTIIGLDTEWLNPIATLQLCVGPNCLIYQLLHSPSIPSSLEDFLGDPQCRFSGVGISGDSQRLLKDYDLRLSSMVDVSKVAAEAGKVRVNAGLKEVANAVLGWEMVKVKEITMSKWNKEVLDQSQVMYACIDAFVSYHIGKELDGKSKNNCVDDLNTRARK